MVWGEGTPSPGTQEGYDMGCTCPMMDNNHGLYPPRPPHGWFVVSGCPVHDADGSETLTVEDILTTEQQIGDEHDEED